MSVPFKVYKRIGDLRKLSAKDFSTTILIYADGYLGDVATCIKPPNQIPKKMSQFTC